MGSNEQHSIFSHLPLCIANCSGAIRADRKTGMAAQGNVSLVARAPLNFSSSSLHRSNSAPKFRDSVIYSTLGSGRMRFEVYSCSNISCSDEIHSEGRDHYVLTHSLSTAATHVFLRNELAGVLQAAGTVSERLNHVQAAVNNNIEAVLFPVFSSKFAPSTDQDSQVKLKSQLCANYNDGLLNGQSVYENWDLICVDDKSLPPTPTGISTRNTSNGMKNELRDEEKSPPCDTESTGTGNDMDTGRMGFNRYWRSSHFMMDMLAAICKLVVQNPLSELFRCTNCCNGRRT